MSKDSILALYGTPSNQQSAMFAVSGIHTFANLNTPLSLKYGYNFYFVFFVIVFHVLGGMYAQQSTVQYNQIPTVVPFGQQTNFPNQQSSLTQLPTQMSVTPNQLPITQNQITVNSTSLGPVASNTLGNCLHVGQINQMNGVPNPAITMQSQMVHKFVCGKLHILELFVDKLIVLCIVR